MDVIKAASFGATLPLCLGVLKHREAILAHGESPCQADLSPRHYVSGTYIVRQGESERAVCYAFGTCQKRDSHAEFKRSSSAETLFRQGN